MVASFERALGVRVAVNDLSGRIRSFLPPDRCYHSNRFCQCVKSTTRHNKLCGLFDTQVAPAHLARTRAPFWKLCHGGIVELVVPLFDGEMLAGRAYVGQFRFPEDADVPADALWQSGRPSRRALDAALRAELPAIDAERMRDLAEVMRAFAGELTSRAATRGRVPDAERSRKAVIENWFGLRFAGDASLSQLAGVLHLSTSRAGQVVRELFGTPFADVLASYRLGHARDLLAHTAFSVVEIAERCGYADPTYFHRVFRKHERTTPLRYRRRHRKKILV
jgi:AraC-like DNA-binding protein